MQHINNTEHKCSGRTDGYGGFTCVSCGKYHENERYKKPPTDKLLGAFIFILGAALMVLGMRL